MFILTANIYLFKVNNKNTREKCKIYWKLTTAKKGIFWKKGHVCDFSEIGKKGQNDVKKEQKGQNIQTFCTKIESILKKGRW